MTKIALKLCAPLALGLLSLIPATVAIKSLGIGGIWRGEGLRVKVTLANDPVGYYGSICMLVLFTLLFVGAAVWSTIRLFRHKTE